MRFRLLPSAELVAEVWPYLLVVAGLSLAVAASAHALLTKSEVRAAIGWVGLIWLSPFAGAIAYFVLGINRIRRKARRLRALPAVDVTLAREAEQELARELREGGYDPKVLDLARRLTGEELTAGNRIEPLVNGDDAYPAMLEAIRGARETVGLCTYIFDNDRAGRQFVDALEEAVARGVQVRVLVDGVGKRYSKPHTTRVLRKRGVPVAEFLSGWVPWRMPYLNLRNHRKILVADGRVAFTGGMNIREGGFLELNTAHPNQDLHFRLEGPIVEQIREVFAQDWYFSTEEELDDVWFPPLLPVGEAPARAIPDGPDDDFETIYSLLLVAAGQARESLRVVTPYFLPDEPLMRALRLAAQSGTHVEIILPEKNNLRLVQWAMTAQLEHVLGSGVEVWLSRPPFDHTKLFLVDDRWALFGSANWDPRSLRLNFEFNVACADAGVVRRLHDIVDEKKATARRLELAELLQRGMPRRLRDGVVRLFQPYL